MLFRLLMFAMLLLAPTWVQARGIEQQLVAEGPAPAGGEVELAIQMRPAPGWHGYWQNPGDAGLPMEVAASISTAPPSTQPLADSRSTPGCSAG